MFKIFKSFKSFRDFPNVFEFFKIFEVFGIFKVFKGFLYKIKDLNVFIYKGQFGNKDFENKKLTLLVVV